MFFTFCFFRTGKGPVNWVEQDRMIPSIHTTLLLIPLRTTQLGTSLEPYQCQVLTTARTWIDMGGVPHHQQLSHHQRHVHLLTQHLSQHDPDTPLLCE